MLVSCHNLCVCVAPQLLFSDSSPVALTNQSNDPRLLLDTRCYCEAALQGGQRQAGGVRGGVSAADLPYYQIPELQMVLFTASGLRVYKIIVSHDVCEQVMMSVIIINLLCI